MEGLLTAFLIASFTFMVTDYLVDLLHTLKANKLIKLLNRKPFNCPVCLSIWLTIIYVIALDNYFILYIAVPPLFTEAMNRHLKELRI